MSKSPSALGRLLEEISWEGNARRYHEGGRGYENVLTAEVFQALDFLPRAAFLGRIIRSARGGSRETLGLLGDQIEEANFSLLPGDISLGDKPARGETWVHLQPDGIIQTTDVYCLLEVKRIKPGAFQPEQLAREYLAVLQEARARNPLLLLVLPEPPPVAVRSYGRMSVHDAIAHWIEPIAQRTAADVPPIAELIDLIDSTVAYVTWPQVAECVDSGLRELDIPNPSVAAAVGRLAQSVRTAIKWHSPSAGLA